MREVSTFSRRQENRSAVNGGGPSEQADRAPTLTVAPFDETEVLSPLERLEMLCDPGSVHVIRSVVRSYELGDKARDGDGVVGASGTIAGRPVFCYAEDGRFAGGSLGKAHADTIVRVLELAADARVPVVGFIESAGARMQEGSSALGAYAKVFRANVRLSGCVPQISIVTGSSAGGGCYSPALTDFVVMTKGTSMFLTGPQVVRNVTGEDVSAAGLGGHRVHARNGVAQFVADNDLDAAVLARVLLSYLPQSAWDRPPEIDPAPPAGGDPGALVPRRTSKVYDMQQVARRIVDGGSVLEVAPRYARNMLTAFARMGGRPVGVIANQPRYLGGVIDAAAAEKGARFVRTCNAYGIPLLVLVDTPGFMPGTKQESGGIIRRGAKLLYAFIEAEVPKLTVVVRQAYGGGFITMNSKELGADFAYAWPRARIGILGAKQAVGIMHRREIAAADNPEGTLAELADGYALEHQSAQAAARDGVIDEILLPAATRERLIAALGALRAKPGAEGRVGNMPL
ncbi:MAG: acyl-CoA carboxylase subunit beta [Actinomycetota bacterium]|nr:acyl-CoA carboxylase subunit beta [Actinomycetota bacterium]